jgi:hypothetical protein
VKPTPRDLEAQEAADQRGHLVAPKADSVSELEPEVAVLQALAWHLARLEARVEGSAEPLRPVYVGHEWAEGTKPARYPSLVVLGRFASPRDALLGIPYETDGRDVISDDEQWGLWRVGEDVGEAIVHVFAGHKPQRDALAAAVQDALSGNLDTLQSLGLPLPEAFLPPPFVGLFRPADFPRARVTLAGRAIPVSDAQAAQGGPWRADIPFVWQAPRLAARRRLPDLQSEVRVTVRTAGSTTET